MAASVTPAERQRPYRQRRRLGLTLVTLTISIDHTADLLVEAGLLERWDRETARRSLPRLSALYTGPVHSGPRNEIATGVAWDRTRSLPGGNNQRPPWTQGLRSKRRGPKCVSRMDRHLFGETPLMCWHQALVLVPVRLCERSPRPPPGFGRTSTTCSIARPGSWRGRGLWGGGSLPGGTSRRCAGSAIVAI